MLCGKGDRRQELEKLANELKIADHVHFLGYRKDIADICRQSDVFALPSRREGLPFAAMEAMYCGLPLVNSGIRGLTDITEDGVSGYICDPDDTERYAGSIRKLKDAPEDRSRMGERNQKTVEAYTAARTKQEILQLMRELLD